MNKYKKQNKFRKLTIVVLSLVISISVFLYRQNKSLAAVFMGTQDGQFILRDPANPTPLMKVNPTTGEVSYAIIDSGKIALNEDMFGSATYDPDGNYYFPGMVGFAFGPTIAVMPTPLRALDLWGDGAMFYQGDMYSGQTNMNFINSPGNGTPSPTMVPIKVGSMSIDSTGFTVTPGVANSLYVSGRMGIGVTPAATYQLNISGKVNVQGGPSPTNGPSPTGTLPTPIYGYCMDNTCKGEWSDIGGQPLPTGTLGQTLYYNESTTLWTNNSNLYNDGTNIGIGTGAPTTKTDVAGTVRAFNNINSAGYPVNDILLPQDVWNSGLNSLSGSFGLDTAVWSSDLTKAQASQSYASENPIGKLTNGNAVIAYADYYLGLYGMFEIYNSTGQLVKSKTAFNGSFRVGQIDVQGLSNGNFVIAYTDYSNSQYGTFVIYNSSGTLVKSKTVFNSSVVQDLSMAALTGGNFLISYTDGSNGWAATFIIYDVNGNLVKAKTVIDASGQQTSATALSNGNAFVAWRNGGGYYAIYNPSGTVVKAATQYDANIHIHSVSAFSGGNVLIAFEDNSVSKGYYIVLDNSGNSVKTKTLFNNGAVNYIRTAGGTNCAIAFQDSLNNGRAAFMIYNSTGTLVKDKTLFQSVFSSNTISAGSFVNNRFIFTSLVQPSGNASTFEIYDSSGNLIVGNRYYNGLLVNRFAAIALANDGVLIAHNDPGDSNKGYFSIFDSSRNNRIPKTAFSAIDVSANITATLLNNGNIFIAFGDSSGGFFRIYDTYGNIKVAQKTFYNTDTSFAQDRYLTATTLTNGNVFLSYIDNNNYGSFVIYDSSGNLLKSATIFNSATTGSISTTPMTNGNILISFASGASGNGKFAIYSSDGNQLVAPTNFTADANIAMISAATLRSGEVFIAYRNQTQSFKGMFAIIDNNGNIVKTQTAFHTPSAAYNSATALPDGNVLIAYADVGGTNDTGYVVYDKSGNEVKAHTQIDSTGASMPIKTLTTTSGNSIIVFTNAANGGVAQLVSVQNSGAKFNRNVVQASGNVGIGTAGFTGKLFQVYGGNLTLKGTGAGKHGRLTIAAGDSTKVSSVYLVNPSYTWELSSRNTFNSPNYQFRVQYFNGASWLNPLAVQTDGNIGIGTGAPTRKLDLGPVQNSSIWCIARGSTGYGTACLGSFTNSHFVFEYGAYSNTSNQKIATDYYYHSINANSPNGFGWYHNYPTIGSSFAVTRFIQLTDAGNLGIAKGISNPTYKLQVAGVIVSSGSSKDYKQNINDLEIDTQKIYDLSPVSFDYKDEYKEYGKILGGGKQIGLLAEDVYKTIPELALSDGTKINNVDYEKLPVLLLAEMKKQKAELDELQEEKSSLMKQLTELENIAQSIQE